MTEREFIERYTFDASSDLLGEGGFGRVYRAYDNYEHEYVALKMQDVNPQYPELRLRNEYEKVQRFTHPYIARYKACYTLNSFKGETDVAVMKYYEAGSLDKLMAKGALSFEQRCSMLEHILEGIDFLHNNGIIHRDLKPQNILIVEHDGKYAPLITDFGISKQLDKGQSSAVSNSILGGTRNYASPEQLKESKIKKNTDLWSFGIIAYEMFTGALPFNCGTFSPTSEEGRSEYLRQVKSGVLPDALNGVPEPWQRLIRACLVVDNSKRVCYVKDCFEIINGGCNSIDKNSDTLCEGEVVVSSDETIVSEPEEKPNVVVVEQGNIDVKKSGKKRNIFPNQIEFRANYMKGLSSIGGKIVITPEQLIFNPHYFNLDNRNRTYYIKNIAGYKKGFLTSMIIYFVDGSKIRLTVQNKQTIIDELEARRQALLND